jgi:phage terminase small subunit
MKFSYPQQSRASWRGRSKWRPRCGPRKWKAAQGCSFFEPTVLTDVTTDMVTAAIRAGYSAKTAREIGHQNLTKLHIAAEIEKARIKRAERTELTQDWVVEELRKIAGANMADYMKSTPEGALYLDFSTLSRDQTAALSQVTVADVPDGKRVTFKLHDKRAALVDLGRHLGMFDAKHKQPEAAVEVTGEELRAVVLRALARLHDAQRAEGGGQGNERPTIEGTSTRLE